MKKKVYISGPITGILPDIAKHNFDIAERFINLNTDWIAVNPMRNGLPKSATWTEHMRKDIKLLMDCDFIYIMKDWRKSKGCHLEIHIAISLNIVTVFEV